MTTYQILIAATLWIIAGTLGTCIMIMTDYKNVELGVKYEGFNFKKTKNITTSIIISVLGGFYTLFFLGTFNLICLADNLKKAKFPDAP